MWKGPKLLENSTEGKPTNMPAFIKSIVLFSCGKIVCNKLLFGNQPLMRWRVSPWQMLVREISIEIQKYRNTEI